MRFAFMRREGGSHIMHFGWVVYAMWLPACGGRLSLRISGPTMERGRDGATAR